MSDTNEPIITDSHNPNTPANTIPREVYRFLLDASLNRGARVVVAVSGGPDSLCLLHVLWRLHIEEGIPAALHLVHLDHQFRGEESRAEAQAVAAIVEEWGIAATVEAYNVTAFAHESNQNKQTAARAVRYGLLARVAQEVEANAVAVAHHANDQAETVLLHLLHGAGPAGLRGMRGVVEWGEWGAWAMRSAPLEWARGGEATPLLIRPLLNIPRPAIETYCREQGLAPQEDSSNASLHYTRNHIRATLLPALTHYNHQIVSALSRTAHICADDYDYLQTQLDRHWPMLVRAAETEQSLTFGREAWHDLHPALQRYALRRAAALVLGAAEESITYEQVENTRRAALDLAVGGHHTVGKGLLLRADHDGFVIYHYTTPPRLPPEEAMRWPRLDAEACTLSVPGRAAISRQWIVFCTFTEPTIAPFSPLTPPTAVPRRLQRWIALDGEMLPPTLWLRTRRAGERFRPAGGRGSRKIQDFFVDQKIPRPARERWPLLATDSAIVWVVGLRGDERFRATPSTTQPVWVALLAEGEREQW
jgi:tRNA(Ile)-lysidine synthetase-like protein